MTIEQKIPTKVKDIIKIGNKYYSLGDTGYSVSEDLENWTAIDPHDESRRVTTPTSPWPDVPQIIDAIASDANGTIVIPHFFGVLVSNDDGETFDFVRGPSAVFAWYDSDEGMFYTVDDLGWIFSSPDGKRWTVPSGSRRLPVYPDGIKRINGGEGFFCTIGNMILYTEDFTEWEHKGFPFYNTESIFYVNYLNGKFVNYDPVSGTLQFSSDGVVMDGESSFFGSNLVNPSINYVNGRYIVSHQPDYPIYYVSDDDGETWTSIPIGGTYHIYDIFYEDGYYIALTSGGVGGRICYSVDLTSWTEASSEGFSDILWNGSNFAAVTYDGRFFTSSNGRTWTEHGLISGDGVSTLLYYNGKYIAQKNEFIYESSDGDTWTTYTLDIPTNVIADTVYRNILVVNTNGMFYLYRSRFTPMYVNKINQTNYTFEYPFNLVPVQYKNPSKCAYFQDKKLLVFGSVSSLDNGNTLIPMGTRTTPYVKSVFEFNDVVISEVYYNTFPKDYEYIYSNDYHTWKKLRHTTPYDYIDEGNGALTKIGDYYYSLNGYRTKNLMDWELVTFSTVDGETWKLTNKRPPGEVENWLCGVFNGNIVVISTNKAYYDAKETIMTSTDEGETFVPVSNEMRQFSSYILPTNQYLIHQEPHYSPDGWSEIGYEIKYTADGINWTTYSYSEHPTYVLSATDNMMIINRSEDGTYHAVNMDDGTSVQMDGDILNYNLNNSHMFKIGNAYMLTGLDDSYFMYSFVTEDFSVWDSTLLAGVSEWASFFKFNDKVFTYSGDTLVESVDGIDFVPSDLSTTVGVEYILNIIEVNGGAFVIGEDEEFNILLKFSSDLSVWDNIEHSFGWIDGISELDGEYLLSADGKVYKFDSGEFEQLFVDPDEKEDLPLDYISGFQGLSASQESKIVKMVVDESTQEVRLVLSRTSF